MKTKHLLIAILATASVFGTQARAQYKLSPSKENTVKVSGTSNVHDWSMSALNPLCEAEFSPLSGEDNIPLKLLSLSFSVNAKSLKSEHASMDTRTYKVINADTHPKITFKLSNAVITPVSKNKFTVKAIGALSLAGVTKTITMQVNGEVKADQSITCTGTEKIKLTDYSIQPPSFMMGAMKVGNDIAVNFNLNFKK